jgi:hypothetical protein
MRIGPFHPCPTCSAPALIWADNSDGITVNFLCPNASCTSGKAPWDVPPPPIEFAAWDDLPAEFKREVDGEREVLSVTFKGEPAWLPHMAVTA